MNQNIFTILISFIIISLLYINKRKTRLENMENCSLNEKNILDNPIFQDLKSIGNNKFYNYISDFNNNTLDKKITLGEILGNRTLPLEKILNSYRVFDPVYNINISTNSLISNVKNEILKTIILNHLKCFNDEDPNLFWIKLHLLNKKLEDFKTNVSKEPLVEMFEDINDKTGYDLNNYKIISFYKHQQNIFLELFEKHPILKEILTDYNLVYNLQLHQIVLLIFDYLMNYDNKKNNIKPQLKNLYLDLRELLMINQIMSNNPKYQFGFSENGKTFVLNHKIFINDNKLLLEKLMENNNTFEKLFNQHSIAKTNQKNIRKVFLEKLKVYLKYNGIKLENDEYLLLNINSVNLEHLEMFYKFPKNINYLYLDLLNKKINNQTIKNNNIPFRLLKSNLF